MPRTDAQQHGPTPERQNHGFPQIQAQLIQNGRGEHIKGNAPKKIKALADSILFYFIDTKGGSFASDIGRRLKLTEINFSGFENSALSLYDASVDPNVKVEQQRVENEVSVELVYEAVVGRDMCNVYGTLHGGCAAYLIDPCSNGPLITLGLLLGLDGTGVSQSMNLIWHNPVHVGSKVTIKATSMYLAGRINTARCEIWTGNKLCVSGVHSTINAKRKGTSKTKL